MIIYRTTGPWGAGKGANLTKEEVDGNFFDLDQRITTAVENAPQPVSVDHTEMIGSTFTVHLTNGQVDGPFEIPFATLTSRGFWGPGVEYNRLDYFFYGGVGYIVMVTHQSPPSFDPTYEVDGIPVYAVAIPAPDQIYDLGFFNRGLVGGGEALLFRWVATRPIRFATTQHDSQAAVAIAFADALVPPASLALVHIPAGGGAAEQFGTITFDQLATVGMVAFTADRAFNVGDALEVWAPVDQDSAAADLAVTLVALVPGNGTLPSP